MYCQKCRAPLRLHGSLDNLNSAAFHLVADAPTATESTTTSIHQGSSQPLYSPKQKYLFETASSATPSNPVFTQTVPHSRSNHAPDAPPGAPPSAGHEAPASDEPADPSPLPKDHSAMSFVDITQSQVVPASIAQKTSNQRPSDNRRRPSTRPSAKSPNGRKNPSKSSTIDTTTLLETTATLFSILSARTDIDHPICNECTDTLLASLSARLTDTTRERDTYISYLQTAEADAPTATEAAAAQASLDEVRSSERTAMAELEALEQQKRDLEKEMATLDAEGSGLDTQEEGFWRERNDFARLLRGHTDERDSLTGRFEHDTRVLERLRRTNVYNDTFSIGHDGVFGTINGLRLGRMPRGVSEDGKKGGPVEWAEINAAWGCACLLLDTIAKRLKFEFKGYRLHPMGSTSSIEKFEQTASAAGKAASGSTNRNTQGRGAGTGRAGGRPDAPDTTAPRAPPPTTSTNPSARNTTTPKHAPTPTTPSTSTSLPLHYTSDLPLSLSFLHRNFDTAMTAFLSCVHQIGIHIEATLPPRQTPPKHTKQTPGKNKRTPAEDGPSNPWKMPYPIHPPTSTVNEVSIRLADRKRGVPGDEQWTRACKYLLTCLKYLLAVGSSGEGGEGD